MHSDIFVTAITYLRMYMLLQCYFVAFAYNDIIILIYNIYLKIYLTIFYFKDSKSVVTIINITIKFFTYLTVVCVYIHNIFLLKILNSYLIYMYLIYKLKIILYLI